MIPQYCAKKAFYLEWLHNGRGKACRPSFVGPRDKAYVFTAPDREDVREARGALPAPTPAPMADAPSRSSDPTADAPGNATAGATTATGAAAATAGPATASTATANPATAAAGAGGGQPGTGDGAAAGPAVPAGGYAVRAGSFQCVWFFSAGDKHHKWVVEWWGKEHAGSADCCVAGDPQDLPQLMEAPKLTAQKHKKVAELEARAAQEAAREAAQRASARAEGGGGGGGGRHGAGRGGRGGEKPHTQHVPRPVKGGADEDEDWGTSEKKANKKKKKKKRK